MEKVDELFLPGPSTNPNKALSVSVSSVWEKAFPVRFLPIKQQTKEKKLRNPGRLFVFVICLFVSWGGRGDNFQNL